MSPKTKDDNNYNRLACSSVQLFTPKVGLSFPVGDFKDVAKLEQINYNGLFWEPSAPTH